MKKMMIMALTVVMLAQTGIAQEVPTAKQIMDNAFAKAKKENKNVFLIFHGSRCKWCYVMDKAMQDSSVSKYFTDNYIITHLITGERNKAKNNAGVEEWFKKSNGSDKDGIPFWGIFNRKGKLLCDSKIRKEGEGPDQGSSVGCPAKKEEVALFIELLKQTSKIDAEGLKKIEERFRKNDDGSQ